MSKIDDGDVVLFRYSLQGEAGEELESSGDTPLTHLHGSHGIVPGLERAFQGRTAGECFEVVVSPADAYGEIEANARVSVPRSAFPDDVELEVGMPLALEDHERSPCAAWIAELWEDRVVLDKNHPLAGVTLRFRVEVVGVREATEEERFYREARPLAAARASSRAPARSESHAGAP